MKASPAGTSPISRDLSPHAEHRMTVVNTGVTTTTAFEPEGEHRDPQRNASCAVDAYLAQCVASATRPNGPLLAEVQRIACDPHCLVTLQLQRSYIGDAGAATLAQCLAASLPFLRAMCLAHNGVGNAGTVALCAGIASKSAPRAVAEGLCAPLLVLDLSHNTKITRVGGQALLNAASRIRSRLALIHLVDTRVTDYFETRIVRHAQACFDRMDVEEQQQVYDCGKALGLVEDLSRPGSASPGSLLHAQPTSVASDVLRSGGPQFLDDVGDLVDPKCSSASPSGGALQRTGSTVNSFDGLAVRRAESTNPLYQSNAPFDEAWYADEDEDEEDLEDNSPEGSGQHHHALGHIARTHSVLDVVRPSAPSGLETILYSSTPDFLQVFSEGATHGGDGLSKRYTITTMPGRERTVYGFTTPSLYEVEVFSYVESYKPRTIALPTKFYFPGPLEYIVAVHAPDPMLHPAAPGLSIHPAAPASSKPLGKRLSTAVVPAPPALPSAAGGGGSNNTNTSSAFPSPVNPPAMPPNPQALQPNNLAAQQQDGAATDGHQQTSMFWSFFHSANAPSTPRDGPRTPNQATPRSHLPLAPESHTYNSHAGNGHPPNLVLPAMGTPRTGGITDTVRHSAVSSAAATPVATPEDRQLLAPVGTPEVPEGSPVASSPTANDSFSSAAAATHLGGEGTPTPGNLRSKTVDALSLLLGKASDAYLGARCMLSSRHASFPQPSAAAAAFDAQTRSKPLVELLQDPLWAPGRPTRQSQIVDYCLQNKLKLRSVSRERQKPTGNDSREYYLQRIIRPSITDSLSAGSMNTSGTMLVTSSYDMTCKVWDLDTGKKVHTLRGHTGHLSDCAWNAPICDKVITSSFDKTLKVWSVASGELLYTLRGHEQEVVCVAVAPGGLECASGSMDDCVIIWDLERGIEKYALSGHTAEIIALDFSPVGSMLVSGSMDETVRVWDTVTGASLHVFEGHTAEVGQVKFNCFGNIVLSGSIDTTCKLWDVKTGRHKTLRGHTHEVVDCDFSPDGWTCASASDDGTMRVWDVLSGGCLQLIVGHERGVCRLAFTASGKELVSGSLDTTAKVWSVQTGECKQTLRGHKGLVLVTYNAASEKILTLSRDNTCRIWKLEPELNTLHHCLALAICSHPTLYSEAVFSQTLPPQMVQYLHRVYRKVFRAEEHVLSAPTPLPNMRSPYPDQTEDEIVDIDGSSSGIAMPPTE